MGKKSLLFFECVSFSRKFHLEEKELILWSEWIKEIFQYSLDWEKGFAEMLKRATTLTPGPLQEMTSFSAFDSLEKFLEVLQGLREDLTLTPLSLEQWAVKWAGIAEKYLTPDDDTAFSRAMKNLRESSVSAEYPFEVIEDVLTLDVHSSFYGNHLHAVCLASMTEGSIVPSRACFMMGMDEESFPRKKQATSLDLLRKEPDPADIDRYLFLQALLNTKEWLTISYGHISEEDGKTMGASLVVQELLDEYFIESKVIPPSIMTKQDSPQFSFRCPEEIVPKDGVVLLSDLTFFARHPWKYYLQKVEKIYLSDRKERSFRSLRSTLARSSLAWPIEAIITSRKERFPGIFQEAFSLDVQEKAEEYQKQIEKWGKKKTSLTFYQTAKEGEFPPLQIQLGDSVVQIIGDIPFLLEDGALHFGDDKISALLKVWPEVLAACVALKTSNIYCLKTGKIKTVTNPQESLKKFVSYYLRCQNTLSPLIPDWADAFLRKGPDAFSPNLTMKM